MRIKINNADLRSATAIAAKAAGRTTSPVTEKFKVSAYDGTITVSSYNFSVSSVVTCAGEIEEEGGCLIDAGILTSLLNKVDDKDVCIETTNKSIKINCGRSKYELPYISETEFPDVPIVNGDNSVSITGADFITAYKKLSPFMSGEMPTSDAMYINATDEGLEFVACDGYRVGIARFPNETGINKSFLVNRDALKSIIPAIGENNVDIVFGRNNLKLIAGGCEVVCRQISERFFDYEAAYNAAKSEQGNTIKAETEALEASIDSAIPVVENSKKNPLTLNISSSKIDISSYSAIGKMNTSCKVTGDIAEPMKIGANASYMLDALKMFDGEVDIKVSAPNKPILIEDGQNSAIVLPMLIRQVA